MDFNNNKKYNLPKNMIVREQMLKDMLEDGMSNSVARAIVYRGKADMSLFRWTKYFTAAQCEKYLVEVNESEEMTPEPTEDFGI